MVILEYMLARRQKFKSLLILWPKESHYYYFGLQPLSLILYKYIHKHFLKWYYTVYVLLLLKGKLRLIKFYKSLCKQTIRIVQRQI